jgi:hypothetical protein
MTRYRRNFIPGGSYFFTVNLADRRLRLPTEHIEFLRSAVRDVNVHLPSRRPWCCRIIYTRFGPCRKGMPIPPCVGHQIEGKPGDLPSGRLPAGAPRRAAARGRDLAAARGLSGERVLAPEVLEHNLPHWSDVYTEIFR